MHLFSAQTIGWLEPFTTASGEPVIFSAGRPADEEMDEMAMMSAPAWELLGQLAIDLDVCVYLKDRKSHLHHRDDAWSEYVDGCKGDGKAIPESEASLLAGSSRDAEISVSPGDGLILINCRDGSFRRLCERHGYGWNPAIMDMDGSTCHVFKAPAGVSIENPYGHGYILGHRTRVGSNSAYFSPDARVLPCEDYPECPGWLVEMLTRRHSFVPFIGAWWKLSPAEAASSYASAGWPVIAVDGGTGAPAVQGPDWGAARDTEQASLLMKDHPGCVPGLLTGEGLAAIECVDREAIGRFYEWCGGIGLDPALTPYVCLGGRRHSFSMAGLGCTAGVISCPASISGASEAMSASRGMSRYSMRRTHSRSCPSQA